MRHGVTLFAALLGVSLLVAAYGTQGGTDVVSHGGPVSDYVSLVEALRAAGATVEPAGEVSQPFPSVEGQVIGVDGHDVQVFEYADEAAADDDAALISPDGGSVSTSLITWIATPHFFRKGRLLVLYVGDDGDLVAALERALGPQFAGG